MTPAEARETLLIAVAKIVGQHLDTPSSQRIVIRDLLRVIEAEPEGEEEAADQA